MRSVLEASLKFRLLVVAAAAAALVVGISQLREMPVDVLPEFVPPTVEIQTEALGLSAAEVEQLITVPVEQDLLSGVAFVKDIRSESVAGLSRILMIFEPGTDLYKARQVVAERLTQAHALPNVSKPPQMLQPLSSTNRVMIVSVSSKKVSALQMSLLARWTIVPRLVGVEGVANVSVWGHRDRQLQIQVDPQRLRDQGVSLLQVVETAGNALWVSPLSFLEASTPGTGGFIDTPNQRLGIQHLSPISTPDDLAAVRLEGKNLRLGDVATVVENHQPLIGDAVVNDGAGLLLVVEKFPEANTLAVTDRVETAIANLGPGLNGIQFDTTVYRPASFIERSIDNLTLPLIIGAVLVALLLASFFFRWRTALISFAVIPLSVTVAGLVLYALGTTMNAIVLAGLVAALAVVIDDAILDTDNIDRRLREHRRQGGEKSTASIIVEASLEVRRPALYATLVIALAVLPFFFFDGLEGAFFPDLAGAYLVALLAAMVVALAATPALSVLLLSRSDEGREPPYLGWIQRRYEQGLSWTIHKPRVGYLAVGAAVVATFAAVPFLGQSLLPTLKETELLVRWNGAPGTSLPEMNRVTTLASRELRSIPGVQNVGAHVGRAVTSDKSVGVNSGELWVSIDPDANYDKTVAAVRQVVNGYPGFAREVLTYSNARVKEVLTGADDDITVRVYGEDLDVLRAQGARVRNAMSGVNGISAPTLRLPLEEPTLQIAVDLTKARKYGIKPGDVRRAASTLLSGITVGSLFERQKVFDVVVWGAPETRTSLTSIRKLLIDTPAGGHVRLGQVADVRVASDPAVIKRQAISRYVDVGVNVSGRDRGDVIRDVKTLVRGIDFPLEYHAEVLAAETQPKGRLIALGAASAIGILLLLQACFGSWRLATLAFLMLPLSVAGGLLAALAAGGTLSFGSYIALAAVFGLAARNGIMLVERFRQLERDEGMSFSPELVLRGARDRLAPVVMTALATALVMLPLAILGGVAGQELLNPMAFVVLGGLVTSTMLTLFVVPGFYLRFGFVPATEPSAEDVPDADAVPADLLVG